MQDKLGGRMTVDPRLGSGGWAEGGGWLGWRAHMGSGVLEDLRTACPRWRARMGCVNPG